MILMKNIFKKLQQRRLRWILRGHRELKQTSNQGKIYQVMQDVVATALSPENVYSKRLYGVALAEAELVTRQYLIARTVVGTHFSKALLYACKKPRAWVTHLCLQNGEVLLDSMDLKFLDFGPL